MIRSVKSIIFFQMLLKYVTKINLTDKNQFTQFCLHEGVIHNETPYYVTC